MFADEVMIVPVTLKVSRAALLEQYRFPATATNPSTAEAAAGAGAGLTGTADHVAGVRDGRFRDSPHRTGAFELPAPGTPSPTHLAFLGTRRSPTCPHYLSLS